MTHETLKAAYEEDAKRTEKPYLLWQVRVDGVGGWVILDWHPVWMLSLHYRRHPHADKMLAYKPGEQWEWYSNSVWRDCHTTPEWHHDLDYRKKPMTLERKQYEADKLIYNEPWKLWEFNHRWWATMQHEPCWDDRIQYRRKPEARPHAHLIKLWADGAPIEKLTPQGHWIPCLNPCWERTATYRQKPAHQTRWIGVYRMPAKSVYIAEGKISREDCVPAAGDTLVRLLEVTINADNSITTKEHECEI